MFRDVVVQYTDIESLYLWIIYLNHPLNKIFDTWIVGKIQQNRCTHRVVSQCFCFDSIRICVLFIFIQFHLRHACFIFDEKNIYDVHKKNTPTANELLPSGSVSMNYMRLMRMKIKLSIFYERIFVRNLILHELIYIRMRKLQKNPIWN